MVTTETGVRTREWILGATAGELDRLFHGNAEQALAEVLDNARLSGAGQVRIRTTPSTLTIEDDGCGIERPEVILTCGESGWKNPDAHCDGIGMYALCGREPEIATMIADGCGWQVRLQTKHFRGEADAEIQPFHSVPEGPRDPTLWPHGTRVTFHYPRTIFRDRAVERAVRHLPLNVSIDGEPAEHVDPLATCCYAHGFEKMQIGIERSVDAHGKGTFHFHSQTIEDRRLPRGRCGNTYWTVRIDAREAVGLRRALPTRARIEENAFYNALLRCAEKVLYTAMARADDIEPNHATWRRAKAYGVQLGAPKARLETWRPDVADTSGEYEKRDAGPMIDLDGTEVLVFGAFEPGDEQVIARAIARTGKSDLKLVRANPDRAGFEWYDQLRRLVGYGARICADGDRRRGTITRPGSPGDEYTNERVDEISMWLEISDPRALGTDRETSYVPVETDLVIINPKVHAAPKSLGIKLLASSKASLATLRDLIAKTCFRVPADAVAQAGEGRLEFEFDAEKVAAALTREKSEALARALAKIAEREIGPLVGRNSKVTIQFCDDGANVRVDDDSCNSSADDGSTR